MIVGGGVRFLRGVAGNDAHSLGLKSHDKKPLSGSERLRL